MHYNIALLIALLCMESNALRYFLNLVTGADRLPGVKGRKASANVSVKYPTEGAQLKLLSA